MIVKKAGGQVFGAELTAAERKALDIEIRKHLAESLRKQAIEIDSAFLWYLREEFEFDNDTLKRIFNGFGSKINQLCERYEMVDVGDDVWLCTHKLKECGIDVEEWSKERGD